MHTRVLVYVEGSDSGRTVVIYHANQIVLSRWFNQFAVGAGNFIAEADRQEAVRSLMSKSGSLVELGAYTGNIGNVKGSLCLVTVEGPTIARGAKIVSIVRGD